MKVHIQGRRPVILRRQDFIAGGGEGDIYGKGDTAYKIYHDPDRMIPDGKMAELQCLTDPHILIPLERIMDHKNRAVGYTMRRIEGADPLCRLFSLQFQKQHQLYDNMLADLLGEMAGIIRHIHQSRCLLVDGNEFNFLIDLSGAGNGGQSVLSPWFIDVDSYQTPSYPASAVLPSIRDPRATEFTCGSDWFAFAVCVCRLFTGIHPYKGKHPDFSPKDLVGRMKAEISIFDPEVVLPPSARPASDIPEPWQGWLLRVLEQGERSDPPDGAAPVSVSVSAVPKQASGGTVQVTEIASFPAEILHHGWIGGYRLIITSEGSPNQVRVIFRGQETDMPAGAVVTATARDLLPVGAMMDRGLLKIHSPSRGLAPFPAIRAGRVTAAGHHFLVLAEGRLTVIHLQEAGRMLTVSVGESVEVMPHASVLFEGGLVQQMLRNAWMTLFAPEGDGVRMYQMAVPELDGAEVIEAVHRDRVVMGTFRRGRTVKGFVMIWAEDWSRYSWRDIPDAEPGWVNFAVLDKGIVVGVEGEELVICENRPDRPAARRIPIENTMDRRVAGMRLGMEGNSLIGISGNRLSALSLRIS